MYSVLCYDGAHRLLRLAAAADVDAFTQIQSRLGRKNQATQRKAYISINTGANSY